MHAQVATLGKGHAYFVNNGLQIWGLDQGAGQFNYSNLADANFTGVMWSYGQAYKVGQLQPGQKWGKWVNSDGTPATALDATEQGKISDLLALQVGDEQQSDIENPNGTTSVWFQQAHAGNLFPNQLLYINSFYIISDAGYANFIGAANPDAISFDSYPFNEPYGSVIMPNNWLTLAGHFRRHALSSQLGIGVNAPRPYGMYLQTYQAPEGEGRATRHPGDVEMRWQQFTAWTMGFSWVDAFTVGGSSSLFNNSNQNDLAQPRYDQFKESARQGRNLGPALTKLISYGYGPSIVLGRNAAGGVNPMPGDWLPFHVSNAPAGQRFLTSLSASNTGTRNSGQPGDLYVGFFNPLQTSYGNPAGTAYFMVTNALGAYLDDETATVADCQQQVTLNFDMSYSTVNSLQRLRRSDGQVETIPLTYVSGTAWKYVFTLEGGTGDLFKYNDGHVFVGAQQVTPTAYWDGDANPANNNVTAGTGMGGGGTWDAAGSRWYDGSAANSPWVANRNPVFWGTAGTVTVASPPSVDSLTFRTNGYTLAGSSVHMNRPFINTDAGVTATIGSVLTGSTGITKAGPGTVRLAAANTFTGGTTIKEGTVQVSSDAALGPAPSTLLTNISLDGGTLQWGANFDLNNNRAIGLGPAGGTIDTQGFTNPSGYNATAGGFRGPGDLTKIGSGTFFAAATTGGANTTWKGRLILKEGTWKIVASDGLPYNVPAADGLQPAQVTLDGGTWQVGNTMNITNGRRGITVAGGGGTIDTQGFALTWAGPVAGTSTSATLTKAGAGTLRLTGASGTPSTHNGNVHIAAGTLQLDAGNTMGDLAAVSLANVASATLNVTGNETLGSLAGGATGGKVTLTGAITLTAGGNGSSTILAGSLSGSSAGLTKAGAGTFTLAGPVQLKTAFAQAGTLRFSDAATSVAARLNTLTFAAGAQVDLTTRPVVVDYAMGGSPAVGIRGALFSGRGGGSWNNDGIVSSAAAADPQQRTAVAYAEAAALLALSGSATATWNGQTVDASALLLQYAYYGDATLDGRVDADDYTLIDRAYARSLPDAVWRDGDFNYDGTVTATDYFLIDRVYLQQGAPLSPDFLSMREAQFGPAYVSELVAAVPEPAGLSLVAGGLIVAGIRRRRSVRRA